MARSELQLSLTLNPQLQRFNVGVFEGRQLQGANKNEGVYIKIVLLQVNCKELTKMNELTAKLINLQTGLVYRTEPPSAHPVTGLSQSTVNDKKVLGLKGTIVSHLRKTFQVTLVVGRSVCLSETNSYLSCCYCPTARSGLCRGLHPRPDQAPAGP